MNKATERYASAIRSGNLASKPDTTFSDSDVVGAHGLAAKRHPLAIALQRFFLGDDREGTALVTQMSVMAWGKAQVEGVKLRRVQADDMARMVLAWVRDSRCKKCGGHGFKLVEGAPALSDQQCPACNGTSRRPFDSEFALERLLVARWLLDQVERQSAAAGARAMESLAPRLDIS